MVKKGIFGQYFKSKRKAKGLTLRQFCSKYGFDPGNISRLERGIFPPPQDRNKLEEFAACLEIEKVPLWYLGSLYQVGPLTFVPPCLG